MKYALAGLLCAAAILWGMVWLFTGSTVAEEGRVFFGDGLYLPYRITNEGGAPGRVRYEVFAERDGRREQIFEGTSGEEFRISRAGPGLIRIRFCNGRVEHVSPVGASRDHGQVMVQPEVRCSRGR